MLQGLLMARVRFQSVLVKTLNTKEAFKFVPSLKSNFEPMIKKFWKEFVLALAPALIGAAGQVGAAAVHGISMPAAKNAISATSTANPTAKVCTEGGSGDIIKC